MPADAPKSCTWYARDGHRVLGTVIAATQQEAEQHARRKYPLWGFTVPTVERRRRKRGR